MHMPNIAVSVGFRFMNPPRAGSHRCNIQVDRSKPSSLSYNKHKRSRNLDTPHVISRLLVIVHREALRSSLGVGVAGKALAGSYILAATP